jgi:membrane associated rhomboid family serine protease
MFPIRDHNPSLRTPYVTYALIALNVIAFLSYVALLGDEPRLNAFFERWALIPARFTAGQGTITIVTSMFLHGGFMHIAGNMLFLWIFGDNLEDFFGHLGFLAFYLACGVAAALAQVLPAPDSTVPMVGASGAIAGVMGGYLLLFPRARVDVLVILVIIIRMIALPAWVMLGFWFGIQLVNSYVSFGLDSGGVAFLAHSGGFAAGLLLTLPFWLSAGGAAPAGSATAGPRRAWPDAAAGRACATRSPVRRRGARTAG